MPPSPGPPSPLAPAAREPAPGALTPPRPPEALLLCASLLVYAAVAIGVRHWWVSGLAAPAVAALLWRRHPRARFSAYVFYSVVAIRGAVTGSWASLAFAAASVLAMQTPAARRAWPRVRPRRRGGGRAASGGVTMARP